MVYLETRDGAFAVIARRWAPAASAGYPELQALVELRDGDTATAQRIAQAFPSPDSLRRAALGMTGMRTIARATVLAELGDLRRAAQLYETIDTKRFGLTGIPETTWPMYVRSYLARGRLFEQLGEREHAMASYERFLAFWKDADAPLQPQLREAREALARLHDVAGVAVKATVR
jgi:tetratricopeptide (TPR) repeat protein